MQVGDLVKVKNAKQPDILGIVTNYPWILDGMARVRWHDGSFLNLKDIFLEVVAPCK